MDGEDVTETYNRLSKNKTPKPNRSMNHSPTSLLKKKKIAGSGGKILFSGFKWEAEATLLWPLLLSGGGGWRGRDNVGRLGEWGHLKGTSSSHGLKVLEGSYGIKEAEGPSFWSDLPLLKGTNKDSLPQSC